VESDSVVIETSLDLKIIDGRYEGRIILRSEPMFLPKDRTMVIRLVQDDLEYDVMMVDLEISDGHSSGGKVDPFRAGWIPFVLTIATALGISFIRSLVIRKGRSYEE
jgi:hypothetical protein